MFTGLITEVGAVSAVRSPTGGGSRIIIAAPRTSRALRQGDSVAVSGVCLTAVKIRRGKDFTADLAAETVARTSLAGLKPGSRVNLELPMRANQRLGGHIVQGHVDGVAQLVSLAPSKTARATQRRKSTSDSGYWLRLRLLPTLQRYVVEKGSIAVEGISLTVARIEYREITIAVVPHTYRATNLRFLGSGSRLNIEVDILAKYAEKLGDAASRTHITMERLLEEGF